MITKEDCSKNLQIENQASSVNAGHYMALNNRKIEQSNGRCFDWQQLLANSIEFFISHEKSDLSQPEIYKALKPC